ncbi:predicted protein [Phaeodactylum tricornutum CCAP 1055/1]|jgi:programmed cell death protein 5|uniref:Uncharacterized protein n=2 Tax=Phaeodactylum tricornutum TaxID=2850 RepID=B5Y567_PHATC|nr:predicted protein [Phaeodactylum tricornutum CCAP 1055/1]ACI65887.1 predicted protein [Phaeodactylum tricornutum CCAP 1055/1]|eukprot:XP_002186417.1 predicted protein [Phaeodactylum tricornutum CCAP 1055/1]
MDNLAPVSDFDPKELPEGFTAAGNNSGASQEKQQQQAQKQAILEQALTPEALARLGRIKLVKAQKVAQLENTIVSMAMSGKLPGQISEGKLIEMLERGSAKAASINASSGAIKIQRKKYAFDSDDDDDDEDLM